MQWFSGDVRDPINDAVRATDYVARPAVNVPHEDADGVFTFNEVRRVSSLPVSQEQPCELHPVTCLECHQVTSKGIIVCRFLCDKSVM
jgi:hypothetical protein